MGRRCAERVGGICPFLPQRPQSSQETHSIHERERGLLPPSEPSSPSLDRRTNFRRYERFPEGSLDWLPEEPKKALFSSSSSLPLTFYWPENSGDPKFSIVGAVCPCTHERLGEGPLRATERGEMCGERERARGTSLEATRIEGCSRQGRLLSFGSPFSPLARSHSSSRLSVFSSPFSFSLHRPR